MEVGGFVLAEEVEQVEAQQLVHLGRLGQQLGIVDVVRLQSERNVVENVSVASTLLAEVFFDFEHPTQTDFLV